MSTAIPLRLAYQLSAVNASTLLVSTLVSDAPMILTFLVLGIVLLAIWYNGKNRAKRTMTWPHVPGKVIESSVVGDKNFDGGDEKARVLYEYVVNGIPLRSKTVGAGVLSSPASVVKRYPIGKEVQVYYDPRNPKSALLERKSSGSIILLLLSIVNLAVAFGTFLSRLIHGL